MFRPGEAIAQSTRRQCRTPQVDAPPQTPTIQLPEANEAKLRVSLFLRQIVTKFSIGTTGNLYFTTAPILRMVRPFAFMVSVTLCGLPVALSVNTKAEVLVPALVGVPVTLTVQDDPLARVPVQVEAPFV